MTTTEQPPEVDGAVVDETAGPIIGRRPVEAPAPETASFQLATYDSRDRETLHKMTARVDIDASSVFGFLSPNLSAAKRVGALRSYLLRALVDDDGIGTNELIGVVVPDPTSKAAKDAEPTYVPVEDVEQNSWRSADLRFRVGDQLIWDTEDEAVQHGRDHGSSLRRFVAIMDDDTLRIEQTALEEIVEYLGRRGSGDHPTKRPKSSSRSRSRRGR